ncbi:lysine--tRNA ligase [Tersicoccus solisilvae]|uniref:Lysine--tRNA ligase n=1 Tax=Tersicoccus solisilvae TaxID=1882339 RepID=A0ABQ1PAG6_9MICC|nr:lysine--tRNA ligase [Tersicoccus solisilvae]
MTTPTPASTPSSPEPADDSAEAQLRRQTSEQIEVRTAKRRRLLEAGVEPYPVGVERTHTLAEVRGTYAHLAADEASGEHVGVAGRVVFLRNTGKLCFATLQAGDGTRLQAMISLTGVGEESLSQWKAVVDLGDHVFVHGEVISSRRGELSVMADRWQMASKALRPLPTLHHDLSEETRVRQRYVDLIVREEARQIVLDRATITRTVRQTLDARGYVEVETPILQLVHGGATARPFNTHMNAFDQDMSLRIATELYLKRAVVGGLDKVYEIGRVFRNEGVDSTHSPEFTMLECYEAYADQFVMADRMREMILACAHALGRTRIETAAGTVDLEGEWRWLSVYPAVSEAVGEEVTPQTGIEDLRRIAAAHDVELPTDVIDQKIVMKLFEELVEHTLLQPTFVCDYPPIAQPLARPHRSIPGVIEAWDLIIAGTETGTAFSELIDPVIQRERLTAQSRQAAAGDEEAMQLDEDFLRALEYAAPPMGGIGLGMDRLVMLFTGVGIRESILFPLMKPE